MLPRCLSFSDHLKQSSQWKQAQTKHPREKTLKEMPSWPVCFLGCFCQCRHFLEGLSMRLRGPQFGQQIRESLTNHWVSKCVEKTVVNHQNPLDVHWFSLVMRRSGFRNPWLGLVKPRIGYLPPPCIQNCVVVVYSDPSLLCKSANPWSWHSFPKQNPLLKTSTSFSIEGW